MAPFWQTRLLAPCLDSKVNNFGFLFKGKSLFGFHVSVNFLHTISLDGMRQ
jgi:hypothetical protein